MSNQQASQANSVDETLFLRILDLNEDDESHMQAYGLMKIEAADGYERLMASCSGDIVSEIDFRTEVNRIYQLARPETKSVYDRCSGPGGEDNWAVRFLLWQVMHAA